MEGIYNVIKRPLLSEKGMMLRDTQNKYSFVVAKTANKDQIAAAVEEIFKVNVVKVTTCAMRGKMHRVGRYAGKRPDFKKAVVTLKKGDKIDVVEGASK